MAWVTKRRASDGTLHYQGRYRDAFGAKRTVGTFPSHRQALKAANRAEGKVLDGTWLDPNAGTVTFQQYAEEVWLPSRHLEASTRAGYRSYLRIHFVPFFGHMPWPGSCPRRFRRGSPMPSARDCRRGRS